MMPTQYKKNPNEDTAYFDGHKVNLIAVPAGTLQLPIHPTSDSGYVIDNNGKKHRVLMATFISGTVDYKSSPTADSAYVTINGQKVKVRLAVKENGALTLSDKPNVDKGYVVGDDSETHRVTLINTPIGTLELPNNETDDSAYIIDGDGNKIKVRMFALLAGGYVEVTVTGVSPLSLPDAIADSLSYVKAFGGTEQRDIPDNYLQRQFIYMMDGSYLLTDIVPQGDYRIEFDFATTSFPSSGISLFGTRPEVAAGSGIQLGLGTTGQFAVDGLGTRYNPTTLATINTRYKYVWNNKNVTLTSGSTTIGSYTFTGEETQTFPFVLNGLNNAGTASGGRTGIYLYSFKVWNAQGELVMNLVPAIQKGTVPVVGFYDTVSKTFKTATAGTFAAGGEAVPTPDTPMDIVSNNGVLKASPNLFDKNNYEEIDGYVDTSTGELKVLSGSSNIQRCVVLNVKPNTTYSISGILNSGYGTFATKTVGSVASSFILGNGTLTTGPNDNYIIGLIRTTTGTYDYFDTLQIETGSAATTYRPYGEIYTDGTVETINIHGKNLFNKDATPYLSGQFINDTTTVGGNIITTANANYNVYRIPVSPSTNYTFGVIKAANPCWAVLDENGLVLQVGQHGDATVNSITVTTDATAKYLCLSVAVRGGYKCDDILQIEKGSTATTYEPYYDGGTATAEMLLSLGDYTDEQEIISGVVTRKLGVAVLDGTETWTKNSIGIFACQNLINGISNQDGYCTHFKKVADTTSFGDMTVGTYKFRSSGDRIIYFNYDTSATVSDWTQYLADQYAAGTPVIVVYPLATATTETVIGQTLQVQAGDNTLEITQASLTGLELECKYKKQA